MVRVLVRRVVPVLAVLNVHEVPELASTCAVTLATAHCSASLSVRDVSAIESRARAALSVWVRLRLTALVTVVAVAIVVLLNVT